MPTEISNTEPASTIVIGQEASQGPRGFAGWTPVIAQIPDGLRLVNKLLSYQGGEGDLPTSLAEIVGKFQKADGTWTSVISEAYDINSGSAANAAIATEKLDAINVIAESIGEKMYGSYVKDKLLAFSTIEKQILRAISVLDLSVPSAQKSDDWRINFVSTIPTTSGFVAAFKYRVMIRNLTTNMDFTLINENASFDVSSLNGVKYYSGTSTNGATSVEYNVGIDWPYLLSLGSTFEYFVNATTNNLKINVGNWEQSTMLDKRLSEFQNLLSDYGEQEVVINTGAYVNTAGNVISLANKSYIVYDATSADQIKITTTISGAALCLVAYKNSAGGLIGTQNVGVNGTFTSYTDFQLTIPANTATIWINKESSFPFTLKKKQLLKAATQEGLDNLSAKVTSNEAEIINQKNILSSYTLQNITMNDGFYYNNVGQAIASASRRYAVITATSSDSIKITTKINGSPVFLAIYRNSLGAIIGTEFQGVDGVTNAYTMQQLTIPASTASIVLNGMTSDSILVYKKQTVTGVVSVEVANSLESRITVNENSILQHRNALSNYTVKNGIIAVENFYMNSSGNLVSSPFRNHKIITASPTDNIRITAKINGSPMFLAVYRNSSNSVIGTQFQGVNGITNSYNKQELSIPTGTTSIVINYMNSDSIVIEQKQLLTSVVTQDQYDELLLLLKPLTGKTIFWLGTSIPEGGLYPEKASEKLGGVCINKAVGSSMMRIAKADGSVNGLAWQSLGYALCHTIPEKQLLIDNWDYYKTILSNSPPATLTAEEQTKILSCSYQNRLLPYLNGTFPMPDLFVIDHGHNDNLSSDTDEQFTSQPSNRVDRNTFLGAMNFIVDLILQYNPRARIAFIGHYENDRKSRISVAQINNAEYWDFPLLRTWEKTGWTQKRVPGSSALWSQVPYSTYSAGQNTSLDLTLSRIWMPDDLHPHTDTSGKAQALLTNINAEFMRGLFN